MNATAPAPRRHEAHGGSSETAAARSWPLPHCTEAVGASRDCVQAAMEAWGIPPASIEVVLLVVSELVTNAMEHATPPVTLGLTPSQDGTVSVNVHDGGPSETEGRWIASCADDEHGRGHAIVDALALDHGTERAGSGSTYWAVLPAAA